ncbi:MAG: HDOD domain-containing protein [Cycloclasticus sp.]|nr:HDOD domain-containing protein [Cycloclasticus sp.]
MQLMLDLEKKIEDLPLLPTIIVRLLALDTNDDNYFEHVLELSQQDPTFALRILRLSNSAINTPISPITTLRHAVTRLGVKCVAGLVTSLSVVRVFVPTKQGEKNLWVHSIQVAVCARVIARMATKLNVDPEHAYICGLLHDIGRFVMFDKASDDLTLLDETNWDSPKQLITREYESFGFNHSEVGLLVCKKWGLPESVITVVANHHTYTLPSSLSSNVKLASLIRIIQIADFFSVFMMVNPDALSWEPKVLEKMINEKCIAASTSTPSISAKQLLAQAGNIIEESNELISALGMGT